MTDTLAFDYPHYSLYGESFVPKIFDAGPGESVPEGFNAVRIYLDATMRSDLAWHQAVADAERYVAAGLKLLWDLDLGLFSRLQLPLSDVSQMQALRLSLAHFADIVWPKFANETLGMAVYRGSVDFSERFPWDLEQREVLQSIGSANTQLFCRDVCSRYLSAVTAGLPGNLQPYLLMDASTITLERLRLQLLHRECWDRFVICVKGNAGSILAMSWDDATSPLGYLGRRAATLPVPEHVSIGLCLPAADMHDAVINRGIDQALERLQGKKYRVIAEEFLTAEWDGLDELVVISAAVGPLTRRKLQGFCAAGGTIVQIV